MRAVIVIDALLFSLFSGASIPGRRVEVWSRLGKCSRSTTYKGEGWRSSAWSGLRAVLTKCRRKPKLQGCRRWRAAIVAACGIVASCSQSPDPRDIAVNTEPPGAVCDLIQANMVIATVNPTPGSAHVASTLPDITFVCRHDGFDTTSYVREWSVGNIVVGGRLGRAIDEMLGVDYAAPVNIAMHTHKS